MRSNPMPDGGIVATYTDISARVEADLALKRANESLEQRVESRTAELTRVNEELAQAQMLAEEANLGKTRFLAAAGHDILQPLNAARLYCSSLIEKAGKGHAGEAARQHRILAGIGRDHSGRGARHLASRRRRHEAGRDGVPPRRPAAPDRHRLPADGAGQEPRPGDRAVVAGGRHRPQPVAPADPEPRLQRHQIHPQRAHPGRRPAARRTRRNPGHRHRHRHRRRQARAPSSTNSPAWTTACAKPRGSASGCRSSTASRACCGSKSASTRNKGKGTRFSVLLPVTTAEAVPAMTTAPAAHAAHPPCSTACPCSASTTTPASSKACGCCSKAGAACPDLFRLGEFDRRQDGRPCSGHHSRRLPSRRRERPRRHRDAAHHIRRCDTRPC